MSLIIEGQNGVGKTRLCNELKLQRFVNYEIIHMTANEPNTYKFYRTLLQNTSLILDRGVIGELVYSEIYGRKSRISFKGVKNIISHVPCYVITMKPEVILQNLIAKGEQNSPECNLQWIKEEARVFKKYVDKLPVSVIPYDFKHMQHYIGIFRG